jgi:hypothetical protein
MRVIACSLCPCSLVPKCIVCIVLNAYNFFCFEFHHSHVLQLHPQSWVLNYIVTLFLVHCLKCIIKCIFFCIILNIECIILILNLWVHCSSSLSRMFMFIIYKPCQLPLSLPKDFRHNFLSWIKSLLFIHLMLVPTKALRFNTNRNWFKEE